MPTYASLKDDMRFSGCNRTDAQEFARLLPAFSAAYVTLYSPDKTLEGKVRYLTW
jgi:hypothetical protein